MWYLGSGTKIADIMSMIIMISYIKKRNPPFAFYLITQSPQKVFVPKYVTMPQLISLHEAQCRKSYAEIWWEKLVDKWKQELLLVKKHLDTYFTLSYWSKLWWSHYQIVMVDIVLHNLCILRVINNWCGWNFIFQWHLAVEGSTQWLEGMCLADKTDTSVYVLLHTICSPYFSGQTFQTHIQFLVT